MMRYIGGFLCGLLLNFNEMFREHSQGWWRGHDAGMLTTFGLFALLVVAGACAAVWRIS